MSPQPDQDTNGHQAELEDLFKRGAILREAARQAREMAREIREASLWLSNEEQVATPQD